MVPYETEPFEIDTHASMAVTRAIGFPRRGWITKIIVKQVSGAMIPFTVDIFNHADALEGTVNSESVSGTMTAVPESIHKVTKSLPDDSPGSLEYFSEFETGGQGLVFVNMDKTPNKLPVGKMYFRITPGDAVASDASFVCAVGGLSALG
jgi:hypothetical protein